MIGLDLAKNVFQVDGGDETGQTVLRRQLLRSLISLFKRGLRRLQAIFQSLAPLPPLWEARIN